MATIGGNLLAKCCIHAVGPNYIGFRPGKGEGTFQEADGLLKKAYITALSFAHIRYLKDVAFPLISSGIFAGRRNVADVHAIAVQAIAEAVEITPLGPLTDIYLVSGGDITHLLAECTRLRMQKPDLLVPAGSTSPQGSSSPPLKKARGSPSVSASPSKTATPVNSGRSKRPHPSPPYPDAKESSSMGPMRNRANLTISNCSDEDPAVYLALRAPLTAAERARVHTVRNVPEHSRVRSYLYSSVSSLFE